MSEHSDIQHTADDTIKLWIAKEDVESSAMEQIIATANHPRLFKHVAIMPDVHVGVGCTIGSVIPLKDAIIPAAVGVDIGCGMCAVKTNIQIDDLRDRFEQLYAGIKERVPMGFAHRGSQHMGDVNQFLLENPGLREKIEFFQNKYPGTDIIPQLGTLGGGNHFIEIQYDVHGKAWIMLHSGSRNIGNKIATSYINLAKSIIQPDGTPADMEFLDAESKEGKAYRFEMSFALNFALKNRSLMLKTVQEEIAKIDPQVDFEDVINIHHNFAAKEEHFGQEVYVHRKGATQADLGRIGIIPGSMGTASYIVEGLGCQESFDSCSHGAGRTMSRTAARGKFHRKTKTFKTEGQLTIDDFKSDMDGIFTKDLDREHLDEAPRAYKDINIVIENQEDLVKPKELLMPALNMKG